MRTMVLTAFATLALTACGEAVSSGGSERAPTTTTTIMAIATSEDQPATTDPSYDAELAPIVERARVDLAGRLDVEQTSIEMVSAEFVIWSDGSLGCPQPGVMYTQALVEGSRVLLRYADTTYLYQAGADGVPFFCESEES